MTERDAVQSGEPVGEWETEKINFGVGAGRDGGRGSSAKGAGETVNGGEVI